MSSVHKGEVVFVGKEDKKVMIELGKDFATKYTTKKRVRRMVMHQNDVEAKKEYNREKQAIGRQETEWLYQVVGIKELLESVEKKIKAGYILSDEDQAWLAQRKEWLDQALKEVYWYLVNEVAAFRLRGTPQEMWIQMDGTFLEAWNQPTEQMVEDFIAAHQKGDRKTLLRDTLTWAREKDLIRFLPTNPAPQPAIVAAPVSQHDNAPIPGWNKMTDEEFDAAMRQAVNQWAENQQHAAFPAAQPQHQFANSAAPMQLQNAFVAAQVYQSLANYSAPIQQEQQIRHPTPPNESGYKTQPAPQAPRPVSPPTQLPNANPNADLNEILFGPVSRVQDGFASANTQAQQQSWSVPAPQPQQVNNQMVSMIQQFVNPAASQLSAIDQLSGRLHFQNEVVRTNTIWYGILPAY